MYSITTDRHKVHSHFYNNLWFYWFSQLVAMKAHDHQLWWPSHSSPVIKAVSRRPHFGGKFMLLCFQITSIITLSGLTGLLLPCWKPSYTAWIALGRDWVVHYHMTITAFSILLKIWQNGYILQTWAGKWSLFFKPVLTSLVNVGPEKSI